MPSRQRIRLIRLHPHAELCRAEVRFAGDVNQRVSQGRICQTLTFSLQEQILQRIKKDDTATTSYPYERMPPRQKEIIDDAEKGSFDDNKNDVAHWHVLSIEDSTGLLGLPSNVRREGLTSQQAKARLEEYGFNQLSEKEKVTLLMRIWKQVSNVLVGILVFVAVVSLFKGIISSGESRITNFIEVGLIVFVIT